MGKDFLRVPSDPVDSLSQYLIATDCGWTPPHPPGGSSGQVAVSTISSARAYPTAFFIGGGRGGAVLRRGTGRASPL